MEGARNFMVLYNQQKKELTLYMYVLKGDGPTLLGRDWLKDIRLDWQLIGMVSAVTSKTKVNYLLAK